MGGASGNSSYTGRECKKENTEEIYHRWQDAVAEFVEVKQACMTFEGEDPEDPLQIEADEGAFGLEGAGQKEP